MKTLYKYLLMLIIVTPISSWAGDTLKSTGIKNQATTMKQYQSQEGQSSAVCTAVATCKDGSTIECEVTGNSVSCSDENQTCDSKGRSHGGTVTCNGDIWDSCDRALCGPQQGCGSRCSSDKDCTDLGLDAVCRGSRCRC